MDLDPLKTFFCLKWASKSWCINSLPYTLKGVEQKPAICRSFCMGISNQIEVFTIATEEAKILKINVMIALQFQSSLTV